MRRSHRSAKRRLGIDRARRRRGRPRRGTGVGSQHGTSRPFESGNPAAQNRFAGATSSSPVLITATRGLRATITSPMPAEAMAARDSGSSIPAGDLITLGPVLALQPDVAAWAAVRDPDLLEAAVGHLLGMTVSVATGTGALVMIPPPFTGTDRRVLAGAGRESPTTRKVTGDCWLLRPDRPKRTAYPSIAELVHGGNFRNRCGDGLAKTAAASADPPSLDFEHGHHGEDPVEMFG